MFYSRVHVPSNFDQTLGFYRNKNTQRPILFILIVTKALFVRKLKTTVKSKGMGNFFPVT